MPKFQTSLAMDAIAIGGSHFKFSGAKLATLGATEYTLVDIEVDCSGSVGSFQSKIEAALKETIRSCKRSPRADNLMVRVGLFDSSYREFHGYKPLSSCNEDDYTGCLFAGGTTALFDGTFNGAKSMAVYGKSLIDQDFSVNGVLFVITDGDDNASTASRKMVCDAIVDAKQSECLESIMTVLIGVNTAVPQIKAYLDDFQKEAGFQQFIAIDVADEKTLAKLGGFISKSISSQSQALGTGGASKSLTF